MNTSRKNNLFDICKTSIKHILNSLKNNYLKGGKAGLPYVEVRVRDAHGGSGVAVYFSVPARRGSGSFQKKKI